MQHLSALKTAERAAEFPIPANVHAEKVVSVHHYTDRLFSFRITRPQSLRFRSGEFVMIGLPNAEKPVFLAYSVASPAWDDELEFFSIKVEDGPLTHHLQLIQPGDTVLLRPKSTGTLVLDALTPGKRLFMISTGTGIAPFASLIRDPDFANGEKRSKNRKRLNAELGEYTRRYGSLELVEKLNAAGVPSGPIYSVDQVFADPQVKHVRMAVPIAHPTRGQVGIVNQAVALSRTPSVIDRPTPGLGEHTDEVLGGLGYSRDAIADLRRRKVI